MLHHEDWAIQVAVVCFHTRTHIKGGTFFTKVRMHPANIDKTTFYMHHGHFKFVVMSFSLSNMPSTFQALMNEVLWPILHHLVLIFFDDI